MELRREPRGGAQPIGYKVSGQNLEASHAPGMRTAKTETTLLMKEI